MTREELLDSFASKRARKISLTWAQFAGAVGALSDERKERILSLANDGAPASTARLGEVLAKVVAMKKLELARIEVEALVADGSVTVDELLNLLG